MKILIVNAWGGNRGDEAMIISLFQVIRETIPSAEVSLLPYRYEQLDIPEAIHQIPGRAGVSYYSFLSPALALVARVPKHRLLLKPLLWLIRRFGVWDTRFLSQFDLIISAPQGPTISDMYDQKMRTVYPLEQARRLGIPYAIVGVSMGPFAATRDDARVESVLKDAAGMVVREDISRKHVLEKFPALAGKIDSFIDLVYATPVNVAGKVREVLDAYQDFCRVLPPGPVGACISLTPARDPRHAFSRTEQVAKMSRFFDHILATTGRTLLLFPHLSSDAPILERLRTGLSDPSRVIIVPARFDSDLQQDLIGKLDFFISTRYHPTIFAIKAGTPFMCIKNQFKVEGMMTKLGIDQESCWQDDSLEIYQRVFDANWKDRVANTINVKKGADLARTEARRFYPFIESLGRRVAAR